MYNDKILIRKWEVAPLIIDSMMPVDFCQNNEPVINFTTDDMRTKTEVFSKNKMNALYLTERIRI